MVHPLKRSPLVSMIPFGDRLSASGLSDLRASRPGSLGKGAPSIFLLTSFPGIVTRCGESEPPGCVLHRVVRAVQVHLTRYEEVQI